MPEAISNTSPLLYLYRIGVIEWLPALFGEVWIPAAVWGTLKVVLEAKAQGIISEIGPWVERMNDVGMWLSPEIRRRILALAGEE